MNVATQELESLLEGGQNRRLFGYLGEESRRAVESQGASPTDYKMFLVRSSDTLPSEIFGPQ